MDTLPPKPRRGARLRRLVAGLLAVALVGALTWGMAAGPSSALAGRSSWAAAPVTVGDGLEAVATIEGETFTVHTVGGERTFLPGVNLGVTVPGRYPGELQLTAEDYRRWFPQMIEMGFRAIRVYTVHPPAFYTELERFNREHVDTPLYLIHGIWPPEELMFETEDLWDPKVVEAFEHEIDEAVAAVHGELEAYHLRPEFGAYEGDVSPWLVAWAIGAEWEPTIIDASDRRNAGLSPYRGELVSSVESATPTETWLASMFDHLAIAQSERGRSVPFTFVNWPTTDPLHHPAEPNPGTEDLVSIDANNIDTSGWAGGQFASYHAYPYFPDFLRHEYVDSDDPYAAYLEELTTHHAGMPVMITEYGVSGGWAFAHNEPNGRTHGMHREPEQMAVDAELLRVIHDQGLAGGFVFEWTDEWFKFTWNTLAYMHPDDRRAMWHDTYTNESFFGVLSVEPGAGEAPIVIDGADGDWDEGVVLAGGGGIEETFDDLFGGVFAGLFDGDGATKLEVTHDPSFLYVHVRTAKPWDGALFTIEFAPADPVDAAAVSRIVVDPAGSRLEWWSGFDPFLAHHGSRPTEYVPTAEDAEGWNPVRLLTARVQKAPWGEVFDAELLDVSEHLRGSSDPEDTAFDSRAGWEADGSTIEIRIPWLALGMSDPSSLTMLDVDDEGVVTGRSISGLRLALAGDSGLEAGGVYSWDPWSSVEWHERTKVGVDVFAQTNIELGGR